MKLFLLAIRSVAKILNTVLSKIETSSTSVKTIKITCLLWRAVRCLGMDFLDTHMLNDTDGKWIGSHEFKHNYYFMAVDNVADSNDSRYWGWCQKNIL